MGRKTIIQMLQKTLAGVFILLLFGAVTPDASDLALTVVVNNTGAPESLSYQEFIKVIRGEQQRWPNGTKVQIALMKTTHPTGSATANVIYSMTNDQLNKYWLSMVFQGKAKAPNFFSSEDELVNYVSITPGAIGIVSSNPTGNLRKLKITGTDKL